MAEAGHEEKKIAEENGRLHEGVPAVTVIVAPISTAIIPIRSGNHYWQRNRKTAVYRNQKQVLPCLCLRGEREGSCLFP